MSPQQWAAAAYCRALHFGMWFQQGHHNGGVLPSRESILTSTMTNDVHRFLWEIAHVTTLANAAFHAVDPVMYEQQFKDIQRLMEKSGFPGFGGFMCCAINCNNNHGVHIDNDQANTLAANIVSGNFQSGGHFCLVDFGLRLCFPSGSLMLFDTSFRHMVTEFGAYIPKGGPPKDKPDPSVAPAEKSPKKKRSRSRHRTKRRKLEDGVSDFTRITPVSQQQQEEEEADAPEVAEAIQNLEQQFYYDGYCLDDLLHEDPDNDDADDGDDSSTYYMNPSMPPLDYLRNFDVEETIQHDEDKVSDDDEDHSGDQLLLPKAMELVEDAIPRLTQFVEDYFAAATLEKRYNLRRNRDDSGTEVRSTTEASTCRKRKRDSSPSRDGSLETKTPSPVTVQASKGPSAEAEAAAAVPASAELLEARKFCYPSVDRFTIVFFSNLQDTAAIFGATVGQRRSGGGGMAPVKLLQCIKTSRRQPPQTHTNEYCHL
ncbi:hypothetical protein DFJ73DRAFT_788004 [Zopfochytrium polystomum]|nr:hypothetical protein DFJ73DRAFT_788004 [Zopfochytrium polystomum]